MPEIKRTALMPYSAQFMYDLVNDVLAYPEFLPWCGGAKIHDAGSNHLDASIKISKAGLNQWFRTRNRMQPPESIEISLVEGPFEVLEGRWRFISLSESGCRIEFEMKFETRRGLVSRLIQPAFAQIANTMVDSFCARARQLHER